MISHNRQPLTKATKLAYGAGEFGPAMAGNLVIFYLLYFLTSVAGIPAAMAAVIPLVGKVWDAINDPLIGWLSDHTKSKWGRRLPWLLYSVVPCAIVFIMHWWVPGSGKNSTPDVWMLFWYYVAVTLVYNAVSSAITVPHTAMMPELTEDYEERTNLVSYRSAFSILGSIGFNVMAVLVFLLVKDSRYHYLTMGGVCALVLVGSVIWCVAGVRRRVLEREAVLMARTAGARRMPMSEQLRIIFTNRPFLCVCAIYLCSWLAVQVTANIMIYYVVNIMRMPESAFAVIALTVMGTAFIVLPGWVWLSHRIGKKQVYFLGMFIWIGAQVGLLTLQAGQDTLLYVLSVLAGFGVSVAYLIPWSMLPDVIEYDELMTGQRREGVYYGFMVLLQKLGLALAVALVGKALGAAGFVSQVQGQPVPEQPESALAAIRFAMGPLPGTALVLGLIFAWMYPITKERYADIVRQLKERNASRDAAGG